MSKDRPDYLPDLESQGENEVEIDNPFLPGADSSSKTGKGKTDFIKSNFKKVAERDENSGHFVLIFDKDKHRAVVKAGDNFHITKLKEHGENTHAVIEGKLHDADEADLNRIYDKVYKEVDARADKAEKNPFLPELE